MNEELLKILLLLSVGQGITLAFLLFFKVQGTIIANRVLAAFILLIVVPLWNEYLSYLPKEFQIGVIHPTFFYLQLLYGPLLYLYVVYFTKARSLTTSQWILLAAGPLAGMVFKIGHFYVVEDGFNQQTWFAFFIIVNLQLLICLAACWMRISEHHRDIKENLSNLEKVKVDWLMVIILGYTLLTGIDTIKMSAKIMGHDILNTMRLAVSISECIFIFLLGYFGLFRPEIHFNQVQVKAKNKYLTSSLNTNEINKLLSQLDAVMEKEEPYLDNEISLPSLSEKLGIAPHHLSQILNDALKQNFYDFINSARINKAKQMLTDARFRHLAIIDIAYQVGFNNKTSFNNAFKKFTQVTPSAFRAENSGKQNHS